MELVVQSKLRDLARFPGNKRRLELVGVMEEEVAGSSGPEAMLRLACLDSCRVPHESVQPPHVVDVVDVVRISTGVGVLDLRHVGGRSFCISPSQSPPTSTGIVCCFVVYIQKPPSLFGFSSRWRHL